MSQAIYIVESLTPAQEWWAALGTPIFTTPGLARTVCQAITEETGETHRVSRYDFTAVIHPAND